LWEKSKNLCMLFPLPSKLNFIINLVDLSYKLSIPQVVVHLFKTKMQTKNLKTRHSRSKFMRKYNGAKKNKVGRVRKPRV
jgi:hypothetical protein